MAPGAEASRRAVAGAMAADRGLPETARAGLDGEGGGNEKPGDRRWRLLGWRALLSCGSGALYDWACAVDDVYY